MIEGGRQLGAAPDTLQQVVQFDPNDAERLPQEAFVTRHVDVAAAEMIDHGRGNLINDIHDSGAAFLLGQQAAQHKREVWPALPERMQNPPSR